MIVLYKIKLKHRLKIIYQIMTDLKTSYAETV